MRYVYSDGIKQKRRGRVLLLIVAILLFLTGLYLLVNTMWPALPEIGTDNQATAKKLVATQPTVGGDRLYLPQINVDVAVVEINGNETAALDKGAIHRAPSSGNPKDGGNFVVAAHRFTMGLTPAQTRLKSPFYHIDKIEIDDEIYVDYAGERYAYRVSEKKTVAPNEVSIERRTESPQLTLYSCGLNGERDNREVIVAKPVGTIAWSEGQPKIKKF